MSTFYALKNFSETALAGTLAAGATSVSVLSGTGSLLPNPALTSSFLATIWNATDYEYAKDDPYVEIVLVTARSTDTLTITRGQDGTSDVAHNLSGKVYKIALTVAKGVLEQMQTEINARESTITAGTSVQYYRGDKTWQTLNTTAVTEGSNLYHTNARVIASTLTGYTSGAGTITSSDTVLGAIQKLNGNVTTISTHNNLSSIQGGTTNEYYHLTNAEYTGTGTGVFVRTSAPSISGIANFSGKVQLSGNQSFVAASSNAYLYYDNTNGLVMYGAGSAYDVICNSGSGLTAWGIPTGTANTTFFGDLSITGSKTVSIANANASTTLSNFTQSLTNAGLLINATYTANAYTSGIFWATSNDNPTKPKAGIFMQETGSGTYIVMGTSNFYATGIVNTVTVGPDGDMAANRYSAVSTATTQNILASFGDSLTTGRGLYVYSNSGSSSSRSLVEIHNDSSAATGTTALLIKQDANYLSQYIIHGGTTIGAFYIGADSLTTGYCATFVSNSSDASSRNLVRIVNQHTSATGAIGLVIEQYAATYAMAVHGYANGVLYYLNGANTTTNVAEFSSNTLTTGSIMSLYSQSTDTSARPLLWIRQNSASATNTTPLQIDHISSGYSVKISQSVNNANACYGIQMNIANSGAGLEYAFRFDGSEIIGSAVGGSQNKKIQVSVAGTNYYIPLHTA